MFMVLQKKCQASEIVNKETMLGAKFYDGKKITLPISEEASQELYNRWLHQATGGIMSALANQHIEKYVDLFYL